jgi:hypothetical protein
METISVTLIIPGTAASLKYERVKDLEFPEDSVLTFTSRGTRLRSNLPYIIATEQEISN